MIKRLTKQNKNILVAIFMTYLVAAIIGNMHSIFEFQVTNYLSIDPLVGIIWVLAIFGLYSTFAEKAKSETEGKK